MLSVLQWQCIHQMMSFFIEIGIGSQPSQHECFTPQLCTILAFQTTNRQQYNFVTIAHIGRIVLGVCAREERNQLIIITGNFARDPRDRTAGGERLNAGAITKKHYGFKIDSRMCHRSNTCRIPGGGSICTPPLRIWYIHMCTTSGAAYSA